ncbi:hypothetical protein HZY97_05515 [Sphingomonas sp. R-74633]|uniref:hypothetical protein n=1 Tax=Sphingomonas sp. R-74633 TaxID=2751188 RepID=UPI0015D2E222|nr:hypothetical protein [Sphingomonas sp. R-74633]NYT40204.1 hypothetical protein [Sphingomonas sp. R-74633]
MVFFQMIQAAFVPDFGLLGLIPLAGLVCAAGGLFLAWRRPSWRLAWFAVPFLLGELSVLLAGLAPGKFSSELASAVLALYFWGTAAAVTGLIWFARGHRPAAVALSVAVMSHAFFACFLNAMMLTGNWI